MAGHWKGPRRGTPSGEGQPSERGGLLAQEHAAVVALLEERQHGPDVETAVGLEQQLGVWAGWTSDARGPRLPWDAKPDLGKAVKFAATDADESQGQLSPDGKWIAYTSDETGAINVYVRPFPSGPGVWRVSVDRGIGAAVEH